MRRTATGHRYIPPEEEPHGACEDRCSGAGRRCRTAVWLVSPDEMRTYLVQHPRARGSKVLQVVLRSANHGCSRRKGERTGCKIQRERPKKTWPARDVGVRPTIAVLNRYGNMSREMVRAPTAPARASSRRAPTPRGTPRAAAPCPSHGEDAAIGRAQDRECCR